MASWTGRRAARAGSGVAIGVAAWLVAGGAGLLLAQELPPALPSWPVGTPGRNGPAAPISQPRPQPLILPLPLPWSVRNGRDRTVISPGLPPSNGRPRPGSPFDPGAAGPGIGSTSRDLFLGGALDARSGWPFVFLHHFAPQPDRVERFWVVQTRECPQVMGSDPWPCLKVFHFDARGELVPRDPRELLAQAVGRPVFIQVQGSLTTPDIALGGLMWSQAWLRENRALPPEAVVVAFDWPSQRVFENDVRDVNEKGRRAYVAGYHLARFVQAFAPGSRICLLGQSYGGRVVPAALHLLGGGGLNSEDHDPPVCLPGLRPDLHLRAILLEGASDHDWLDPGQRFDRALYACEGLLNLYNRRDEALILYPFLFRGGHRKALGRIGLEPGDFDRLGPLAARYEEHDTHDLLGPEHTLLDAVANRQIARWMAPTSGLPTPAPPRPSRVRADRAAAPALDVPAPLPPLSRGVAPLLRPGPTREGR